MRFRRPSVHYGTSPEPVTPYQRATQAWDERLGSARVQAHNWRAMAFGCLLLAIGSTSAYVWRSTQSLVTPYVVEVARSGEVRAVGEAATPYQPRDAQIAHHLEQFVANVRSVSIDPIVVRKQWLDAYAYTTDRGAAFLNEYARQNDPFAQIGKRSITVAVSSIVRASDKSFQVQWEEKAYVNGTAAGSDRWTAILTIVLQPPNTEAKLRANPLGIYVDGISWSRQLSTNALSGGTSP
ncbi:conjugal transfer protein TrbF [Pigmentiphaga sp. GD03639]|uniref:conjugal transfer protein TrbF n=1 Tax=unclassified Pigmentiphaga TaxID=2626614 RepID=UPI000B413614|nr:MULTISPECIES: conjugal transfer protein TrbF [unclassified Pigmentiphaga]MDH2240214.1 conjugal transfer protein TrbF [Pigmentiphaga sp. GD03639]OVZ63461.1 conjugal transfer protein TrbF [Pigmentiphaga sp. NML030171]